MDTRVCSTRARGRGLLTFVDVQRHSLLHTRGGTGVCQRMSANVSASQTRRSTCDSESLRLTTNQCLPHARGHLEYPFPPESTHHVRPTYAGGA